ncbi:MAG TPA: hypothetical protein VMA95_10160 [Streptosporangiaceae bacterium]|nr:hypothetical protein [Streptosporangiaceae bacterium]
MTAPTHSEHGLAVATLVSWLLAEAFGAYMLSSWLGRGGHRAPAEPGGVPRSVIFGHAGLAFTGFVFWVSFVLSGVAALSWLSVGFLAPAVGLGISTVTLWTPYPARQPETQPDVLVYDGMLGISNDEQLTAVLEDEALTTKLVDELVASVLSRPQPAPRRARVQFSPLIPAAHGIFALITIALAVLAAVTSAK